MKNRFTYLTFFFVLTITLASAQSYGLGGNLANGMYQIIDAVEGLLGPFFSVFLGGTGTLLFERVLFLLIIFSMLYLSISQMSIFQGEETEKKTIRWLVTITVSLLATRFLSDTSWIQTIILPYTALGVTLTAILPTIIYFFFVQQFTSIGHRIVRKILWIFYSIVHIALWSSRYDQLGKTSWIYFWTAIAALVFFLLDGTIQRMIVRSRMEEVNETNKEQYLVKLKGELDQLRKDKNYYTPGRFSELERRKIKDIEQATKARL